MRALVIYESMFGNTRAVAEAVAEGVGHHLAVETLEVGQAPSEIPEDVALVLVGAPTHAHGMTTPSSRADAGRRAGERLVSRGGGIREWIDRTRPSHKIPAVAFDTRIKGPVLLWGSAAKAAAKQLVAAGFRVPEPPRSFLVNGPTGPLFDRLIPGELDRARAWGREIAAKVEPTVAVG